MPRNIGKMGEHEFSVWCNAEGIQCNRSTDEDTKGWDHFLEIGFETNNLRPIDLLPEPISCKIQIKSTERHRKSIPAKLSTLLYMVKSTIPAFFVFIEWDGKPDPQRVYIRHIGTDIIESALMCARKAYVENKNIAKINLNIKYSQDDLVNNLNSVCIIDKILSFIPNGMREYLKWKDDILKNIGYSEGCAKGIITFKCTPEEMKNFALNRKESLVGKFKSLEDIRFGINYPIKQEIIGKESIIKYKSPEIEIEVGFANSKIAEPLYIKAKRVISGIVEDIRIYNDFFDIEFGSKTASIIFTQKDEIPRNVNDWCLFVKFYELISSNKHVYMFIKHSNKNIFISKITTTNCNFINTDIFTAIRQLKIICDEIQYKEKISISDIMQQAQKIMNFYKVLSCNKSIHPITVEPCLPSDDKIYYITLPVVIQLNDKVIYIHGYAKIEINKNNCTSQYYINGLEKYQIKTFHCTIQEDCIKEINSYRKILDINLAKELKKLNQYTSHQIYQTDGMENRAAIILFNNGKK